jgi:hypothetical protein
MTKPALNLAMLNALATCQALDSAAEALATADAARWAGWLCYFFQALEHRMDDPAAYRACLEQVSRDIAGRLEGESW